MCIHGVRQKTWGPWAGEKIRKISEKPAAPLDDNRTEDGRFTYAIRNNTVEITKYLGNESSVEIPSEVSGMPVTSIGYSAFSGCSSITDVLIPASVSGMYVDAFTNCPSLVNIQVDAKNTAYTSEDGILFNKEKTELIVYPAGRTAEYYEIPENVEYIEYYAFSYCGSLVEVSIPASVSEIGDYIFDHCDQLKTIVFKGTEVPTVFFMEDKGKEDKSFGNTPSLEAIYVPDAAYEAYVSEWPFWQDGIIRRLSERPDEPVTPALFGDVDGNGKVESQDALQILKYVVKLSVPVGSQSAAADVDKDNNITSADALLVLKMVVKLV